jgi:hypothetical protein
VGEGVVILKEKNKKKKGVGGLIAAVHAVYLTGIG